MIIKHNEIERKLIQNMRGGEGSLYMQRFDDESKMIAKITIPPQSSIGLHQHINDEEIIYVIEGQGICISDGKEFEISKGLVNYTRRGESHSIKNTSDHELVLLAIIFK